MHVNASFGGILVEMDVYELTVFGLNFVFDVIFEVFVPIGFSFSVDRNAHDDQYRDADLMSS